MKSKEVLSAMTPLPWRIKKFSAFNTNIIGNGEWGRENDICEMSGAHSKSAQNTNAAAIVSAINGTYGAGVDPAAVKDLLEACEVALRMYNEIEPIGGWQYVHDSLEAAISKATLKPNNNG